MKPTLRLLIVANNCNWLSWPKKIENIKRYFAPKIDLEVDLMYTNYGSIPFVKYNSGDPTSKNAYGVDEEWYKFSVSGFSHSHDIILFVMPLSEWLVPNDSRGWRTKRRNGTIELQVGADELENIYIDQKLMYSTFEHYSEHEIIHALYMITEQEDKTHYYDYTVKNLAGAFDDINFKNSSEGRQRLTIPLLKKIVELYNQLKKKLQ